MSSNLNKAFSRPLYLRPLTEAEQELYNSPTSPDSESDENKPPVRYADPPPRSVGPPPQRIASFSTVQFEGPTPKKKVIGSKPISKPKPTMATVIDKRKSVPSDDETDDEDEDKFNKEQSVIVKIEPDVADETKPKPAIKQRSARRIITSGLKNQGTRSNVFIPNPESNEPRSKPDISSIQKSRNLRFEDERQIGPWDRGNRDSNEIQSPNVDLRFSQPVLSPDKPAYRPPISRSTERDVIAPKQAPANKKRSQSNPRDPFPQNNVSSNQSDSLPRQQIEPLSDMLRLQTIQMSRFDYSVDDNDLVFTPPSGQNSPSSDEENSPEVNSSPLDLDAVFDLSPSLEPQRGPSSDDSESSSSDESGSPSDSEDVYASSDIEKEDDPYAYEENSPSIQDLINNRNDGLLNSEKEDSDFVEKRMSDFKRGNAPIRDEPSVKVPIVTEPRVSMPPLEIVDEKEQVKKEEQVENERSSDLGYIEAFDADVIAQRLGLVAQEVKGDGSCMFRAVSYCLTRKLSLPVSDPRHYLSLRERAVQYQLDHIDELLEFFVIDKDDLLYSDMLEDYEPGSKKHRDYYKRRLEKMKNPDTFSDNQEIYALAYLLNICINSLSVGNNRLTISKFGPPEHTEQIYIIHNGLRIGGHYWAATPPGTDNVNDEARIDNVNDDDNPLAGEHFVEVPEVPPVTYSIAELKAQLSRLNDSQANIKTERKRKILERDIQLVKKSRYEKLVIQNNFERLFEVLRVQSSKNAVEINRITNLIKKQEAIEKEKKRLANKAVADAKTEAKQASAKKKGNKSSKKAVAGAKTNAKEAPADIKPDNHAPVADASAQAEANTGPADIEPGNYDPVVDTKVRSDNMFSAEDSWIMPLPIVVKQSDDNSYIRLFINSYTAPRMLDIYNRHTPEAIVKSDPVENLNYFPMLAADELVRLWISTIAPTKLITLPIWCDYIEQTPAKFESPSSRIVEQLNLIFSDIHYLSRTSNFYHQCLIARKPNVSTKSFYFIKNIYNCHPEIAINHFPLDDIYRTDFITYPSELYVLQMHGLSGLPRDMILGPNRTGLVHRYRLRRFVTESNDFYVFAKGILYRRRMGKPETLMKHEFEKVENKFTIGYILKMKEVPVKNDKGEDMQVRLPQYVRSNDPTDRIVFMLWG